MTQQEQENRQQVIDLLRAGCTRQAAEIADGLGGVEFMDLIALSDCEETIIHGTPFERQCAREVAKGLEKSLHEKYTLAVLHYQK